MEQVADGVFATDHAVAEGKNAVVIGTRAALPIDAGTYSEEGDLMAAQPYQSTLGRTAKRATSWPR